ncbi:hypothetical protein [Jannaschia sp. LMIT008]|uniref:hypothetical protein n=1 Tax=Jannaschia maritima TaxID=3032585 RepID=UPI00281183C9|nr:hypothetical protein [Jannaschia sp. LMIT008]
MTDQDFSDDRDDLLADIEGQARAALTAMASVRRVVERATRQMAERHVVGGDEDLPRLQRELGAALRVVTDVEGKAKDARLKRDGGGGLDLDAARREVADRLARIHAAGSTDGMAG